MLQVLPGSNEKDCSLLQLNFHHLIHNIKRKYEEVELRSKARTFLCVHELIKMQVFPSFMISMSSFTVHCYFCYWYIWIVITKLKCIYVIHVPILYCAVLYCTVLYYIVLCCPSHVMFNWSEKVTSKRL